MTEETTNTGLSAAMRKSYPDVAELPIANEAAVLDNLERRLLAENAPHTRVGGNSSKILLAVNPFRTLPELYDEAVRNEYAAKLVWGEEETAAARDADADVDADADPRSATTTTTFAVDVEPHVYEVSARAYRDLAFGDDDGVVKDQSILTMGESGSGKTETVRHILRHIVSMAATTASSSLPSSEEEDDSASSSSSRSNPGSVVANRVLASGPLLEAFGNARTKRNDNSSCFGSYTRLQFDRSGGDDNDKDPSSCCKLAGSKVEVFVPGTARLTHRGDGERNYHIFYRLLAAADAEKTAIWSGLKGTTTESFRYVAGGSSAGCSGAEDDAAAADGDVDGGASSDDKDGWNRTVKGLETIGVTGDKFRTLFEALCVVLQLGNIAFAEDPADGDRSVIRNEETDDLAALGNLTGVPAGDLTGFFTQRTMRCRSYRVPVRPEAAKESVDRFAREIYSKTFLWLVRTINDATCAEQNYCDRSSGCDGNGGGGCNDGNGDGGRTLDFGVIGLVDVAGFGGSLFNKRNGFEELLNNYCNEKLQAKYNADVFGTVLEEYERDGMSIVHYDDNTDVLDLIGDRCGLLALLNEECVRPRGSDHCWIAMAVAANKKRPCLFTIHNNRRDFGIHHYAGKVVYDSKGFVSSNTGALHRDFLDCARMCKNEIISKHLTNEKCSDLPEEEDYVLFGPKGRRGPPRRRPRRCRDSFFPPTFWSKFKSRLAKLMYDLGRTNCRYIRCINPNPMGVPAVMQHAFVVDQIRSAGVVAAGRLSQSTFSDCVPNETIASRFFSLLLPPQQRHNDGRRCPSSRGKINPDGEGGEEDPAEERLRRDCDALLAGALRSFVGDDVKRPLQQQQPSFAVGKTKSYFRPGALDYLEALRRKELESRAAAAIQGVFRDWFVRKQGWVLIN